MVENSGRIEDARAEGTSCVDDASGNPSAILLYGHPSYKPICDALRDEGFRDCDTMEARYLLTRVSIEHLAPYLRFVKRCGISPMPGVRAANEVLTLDRRFQSSLFKYIGIFESQVKAQYSHWMLCEHGAFAHEDPELFRNRGKYNEAMNSYEREARIRKKLGKNAVVHLPIGEACECMTLGTVTKLLSNTADSVVTGRVSRSFGVSKNDLDSWSRTIANVRNICAHYDNYIVRKQIPTQPLAIRGLETGDCGTGNPFYVVLLVIRLLSERGCGAKDSNLMYAERMVSEVGGVLGSFLSKFPELQDALGIPDGYGQMMEHAAECENMRWVP